MEIKNSSCGHRRAAEMNHQVGPYEGHSGGDKGRGGLERPVTLALRADDPITAEAAAVCLQSGPQQVRLLPAGLQDQSEVLLVMVGEVTDETVSWMRRASVRDTGTRAGIVLVADSITEQQLIRAVGWGLTCFLHRRRASFSQVLRAVVKCREGRAELPDTLVASLVEHLRAAQQLCLGDGGLRPREMEVLRLLADGLDTAEMASKLSYSERTIKNIIHGMITRLGLRNRAHAVAHGIRTGLI
jgi:DNA-binding NarL/FixJ family response regulator